MSIYQYSVKKQDGTLQPLSHYQGNVLLVVNTATQCGFTPQYAGLQQLYIDYQDRGFTILDFPCDQFGHQAPGTDEEIHLFCEGRFGVTFPQFSKIEVNGEHADPLWTWLKKQQGGLLNEDIKWNFTKFLIDREGHVVNRFAPQTTPDNLRKHIEKLL